MAKGLRASSRKKNNAALRTKVFDPVANARTNRLSAKLQELAAKPKPESEKIMEVDATPSSETLLSSIINEEMDIDTQGKRTKLGKRNTGKKQISSRVEKKIFKKKPRNSIIFAPLVAKQKRQAESRKRKG